MGSAIGWVLWLLYTALLGVLYSRLPPNPDQQIFDYIGWVGLNGSRFYIDVVEQNLPGEMLLHELSTWLFGNQIWAYRVLDYALMVLVGCGALFALCRLAGRPRESYLVVPLYQAMYVSSGAWFAGQRDIGAAHFLLAVGAALIWRERGGRASWLVAIGLGIVGAVLIRPNYLVYTLPLVAHDLITARVRPRPWRSIVTDVLIVAGVIIPMGKGLVLVCRVRDDRRGSLVATQDRARCPGHLALSGGDLADFRLRARQGIWVSPRGLPAGLRNSNRSMSGVIVRGMANPAHPSPLRACPRRDAGPCAWVGQEDSAHPRRSNRMAARSGLCAGDARQRRRRTGWHDNG